MIKIFKTRHFIFVLVLVGGFVLTMKTFVLAGSHVNDPPGAPTIAVPSTIYVGETNDIKFKSIDPNNNNIKYWIDWENTGTSESTSYKLSGVTTTVNHIWYTTGSKSLSAYAEDIKGATSSVAGRTYFVSDPPNTAGVTQIATNITSTSMTLNGISEKEPYLGWFRYSTKNPGSCNDFFGSRPPSAAGSYASRSAAPPPSTGYIYDNSINGLNPHTVYYYCMIQGKGLVNPNVYGEIMSAMTSNSNPSATTITGNDTGLVGSMYTFDFTATDSDGDLVRYHIDWNNDGTIDESTPLTTYTSSGATESATYSWDAPGTYTIRAWATDNVPGSYIGTGVPSTHEIVISAPKPNLSAGVPTISNGSRLQGGVLIFTADVSNTTVTGSSITFNNRFEYRWGVGAGVFTELSTHAHTSIGGNETMTDISDPLTLVNDGNLRVRYCVDTGDTIIEEDEDDNCSAITDFMIISGNLSVSSSTVNWGESVNLSWSTENADSCIVSGVPGGESWPLTNNLSQSTAPLTQSIRYDLVCDTDVLVDFVNVTVEVDPVVRIIPPLTPSGDTATISWDTNNNNEGSCTINGVGYNNYSLPIDGDPNTGSMEVTVEARSTFTLSCPDPNNVGNFLTAEVTVAIDSVGFEF